MAVLALLLGICRLSDANGFVPLYSLQLVLMPMLETASALSAMLGTHRQLLVRLHVVQGLARAVITIW